MKAIGAAKENTGGQAQIDAAQECLAQISQFNGTLSQRRILGADAEVRNVYAGLQGIQQEMYDAFFRRPHERQSLRFRLAAIKARHR